MKTITIKYCTSWGYLPKALDLAENILKTFKNEVANLMLIPSTGGVFEVTSNNKLLFSKKDVGRFPSFNELEEHL